MPLDRQLRTLVKDRVDRSKIGKRTEAARAMLFATFIVVALSVVWWAALGGATRGQLYSPGHVSKAHAQFENDCAKCHAGDGQGGFSKQVTDTACIACHDGSMHHPNQLVADAAAGVSRATLTLAVTDASHPPMAAGRSADCVSCHTEHRGEDFLAGRDDSHCTVCHSDLPKATQAGSTAIQANVTRFDLKNHPPFGRAVLRQDRASGAERLTDPTQLKFNHRKHLADVASLKSLGDQSCVKCHEFSDAAPGTLVGVATQLRSDDPGHMPPPFAMALSPRKQPSVTPTGAYTLPIRYERHCAGCHELSTPGSMPHEIPKNEDGEEDKSKETFALPQMARLTPPHAAAPLVRDFIAGRVRELLSRPDGDFKVKTEEAETDTRAAWLAENFRYLKQTTGNDVTIAEGTDPLQSNDVNGLVDLLTLASLNGGTPCLKCHIGGGQSPSDDVATLALQTVPSGIPSTSRRWFRAANFDHRAHRDMNCVACHSTLSEANLAVHKEGDAEVEQTSFVNSPGMVWADYSKTQAGGAFATRSCVDCHHADGFGGDRGAPASCVTCHNFHDRSLEVQPALKSTAVPTTAPASPLAAAP